MNNRENGDQVTNEDSSEEEWSWTAAPAIPGADGRIWVKLLAYDGEYPVSYIYEHPTISTPANSVYEVDAWLADLWRSPHGNLYAAGEAGRVHSYRNGRWHVTKTPASSMLTCIWGPDDSQIYATTKGAILRFDGEQWTFATTNHDYYIDRLRGTSGQDIYAVGRRGLMLHFDGRSWRVIDVPTNLDLSAVCPVARDLAYVVGPEGIVMIGSGNYWKLLDFDDIDFVDVAEYQGVIYLAAAEKGILRLENDELIPCLTDIQATRLTAAGGFLCAAGDLSVHRFDGNNWESYHYVVST